MVLDPPEILPAMGMHGMGHEISVGDAVFPLEISKFPLWALGFRLGHFPVYDWPTLAAL